MFAFVMGGSASGKSEYAERLAQSLPGPHVYLATMHCGDEECARRILRHRQKRAGRGFETLERERDLAGLTLPAPTGTVLLEDLGNWAGNERFAPGGTSAAARQAILAGVDRLLAGCENLVVVSNEIFMDGTNYDPTTLDYMKLLAAVHRALAARADLCVQVCAGRPVYRKGKQ